MPTSLGTLWTGAIRNSCWKAYILHEIRTHLKTDPSFLMFKLYLQTSPGESSDVSGMRAQTGFLRITNICVFLPTENNDIYEHRKHTRPSYQSVSYLLRSLTVLFSNPDFESRWVSWSLFRKPAVITQYLLYPKSMHGNDSITTYSTILSGGWLWRKHKIYDLRVRTSKGTSGRFAWYQIHTKLHKGVATMISWRCAFKLYRASFNRRGVPLDGCEVPILPDAVLVYCNLSISLSLESLDRYISPLPSWPRIVRSLLSFGLFGSCRAENYRGKISLASWDWKAYLSVTVSCTIGLMPCLCPFNFRFPSDLHQTYSHLSDLIPWGKAANYSSIMSSDTCWWYMYSLFII